MKLGKSALVRRSKGSPPFSRVNIQRRVQGSKQKRGAKKKDSLPSPSPLPTRLLQCCRVPNALTPTSSWWRKKYEIRRLLMRYMRNQLAPKPSVAKVTKLPIYLVTSAPPFHSLPSPRKACQSKGGEKEGKLYTTTEEAKEGESPRGGGRGAPKALLRSVMINQPEIPFNACYTPSHPSRQSPKPQRRPLFQVC